MSSGRTMAAIGLLAGLAGTGSANAAIINVSGDITTSQTWTANNTYNLTSQVYVKPGATLCIEAGTVVASTPTANGSGSLAITRGAQIYVQGEHDNPVIMTSTNDDFVTWREAANEWGNLTIMGNAYISNTCIPGNTPSCNCANQSPMEGLTPDFVGDPDTVYGGCDDDDDSGCISFLSLRYGGRVVGLANELNGLSLGGIGRGTDIKYVEIMNNVDDGIEIWGGTVNLKYISIWNIGDDNFDIDQGWRGKAQFGLLVQGYSLNASQGSGVGDNMCETDGAENSDAQPVTTAAIYNFTMIGQPVPGAGDGATVWRDNARVQYRQSIIMDCGERVVRFDNNDGDGCTQGYGFNGTLSWASTWTTPYTATSTVNPCSNPAARYQAQSAGNATGQGFLAEITDTVFFRNLSADAYTEANARGVTTAGGSNAAKSNVVAAYLGAGNPDANMPIVSLGRAAPVVVGGTTQIRVNSIDPRAANAAVNSAGSAPDDGFFTPVNYRGAFGPNENWLCGWSAADAYGFIVAPPGGCVEPANADPCTKVATCAGDISGAGGPGSGDGNVDSLDFLLLIGQWGSPCVGSCEADITGSTPGTPDGNVDSLDFLLLISQWGTPGNCS